MSRHILVVVVPDLVVRAQLGRARIYSRLVKVDRLVKPRGMPVLARVVLGVPRFAAPDDPRMVAKTRFNATLMLYLNSLC